MGIRQDITVEINDPAYWDKLLWPADLGGTTSEFGDSYTALIQMRNLWDKPPIDPAAIWFHPHDAGHGALMIL